MVVDRLFPCFPIPISIYNFKNEHHELNTQLLDDIYSEKNIVNKDELKTKQSRYRDYSIHSWNSPENMHTRYSSFKSLKSIIEGSISDYCDKSGHEGGIEIDKIWSVCLQENQYIQSHIHYETVMTGVYYPAKQVLDNEYVFNYSENASLLPGHWDMETGGCLALQDPSYALKSGMRRKKHIRQPYTMDHYHYYPIAGTLVLMPSYLMHSVLPFKGKGERISISFSCQYKS